MPNRESVMNLASGLIGPPEVTVNVAREVGVKIIKSMKGHNPLNLKILKLSLAVQIPSSNSKKVAGANVASALITQIDTQLLFQRALNFANDGDSDTSLEEVLEHELFPVSLPIKADLATYLIGDERKDYDGMIKETENNVVFDGGALLHRVGWDKQSKFFV